MNLIILLGFFLFSQKIIAETAREKLEDLQQKERLKSSLCSWPKESFLSTGYGNPQQMMSMVYPMAPPLEKLVSYERHSSPRNSFAHLSSLIFYEPFSMDFAYKIKQSLNDPNIEILEISPKKHEPKGLFIDLVHNYAGEMFQKWMVIFGDDVQMNVVVAVIPLDRAKLYKNAWVAILQACQFGPIIDKD